MRYGSSLNTDVTRSVNRLNGRGLRKMDCDRHTTVILRLTGGTHETNVTSGGAAPSELCIAP